MLAFVSFILIGVAATAIPAKRQFKNLKVLRKNISRDELEEVMNNFKSALGVDCEFCHTPSKDTSNHTLDYASDAKSEKNITRSMMRMTARINKKYFGIEKNNTGIETQKVGCINCHHGKPGAGEKQ